jgi:DNA-binding transcriptional LysR family regulator
MHLKAHRYFAMVAVTGNFSATARHFRVPASSVSRFIAALKGRWASSYCIAILAQSS